MPPPPPPPPLSSFSRSRWLAFFAELTAKLTHHNALVVIEGCEMLKRLLLSRISIAAVLQEGDLLQCLLDTIVGGVRNTRVEGPSRDLNDELAMTQLGTLALCVDLIVALYMDGDDYYCILVQGRLAALVDALVRVLERQHAHLHGLVAKLLAALLPLSASRRTAAQLERLLQLHGAQCRGDVGAAGPSVALRCHINELVANIDRQGEALQRAADVAGELVSRGEGPVRFAAIALLHLALRRVDAFSVFRRRTQRDTPNSLAASHRDAATTTTTPSSSQDDCDTSGEAHRADVDVTINPHPATSSPARKDKASTSSSSADHARAGGTATNSNEHSDDDEDDRKSCARQQQQQQREAKTGEATASVTRQTFAVPDGVLVATLTAIGTCRSHEEFHCAMSATWCLTVADGAALARHFTPMVFDGLRRFLTRPPATRPDRLVFLAALGWVGHIVTHGGLPDATRCAVQEVSGAALLRMLLPEGDNAEDKGTSTCAGVVSSTGDGGDGVVHGSLAPTPSETPVASVSAARASERRHNTLSGLYTTPLQSSVESSMEGGRHAGVALPPSLLPYAVAECRARELPGPLAELPPVAGAVMSFVLNVGQTCEAAMMARWVAQGVVLRVVASALHAVEEVQSVLLESPTALDGALNDEIYLDGALRAVRSEDTLLAALACKLLVVVLAADAACETRVTEHVTAAEQPQRLAELVSTTLLPLLAKIATRNPTLTSARENLAGSALYHSPGNPRSARYTALGECALVALDTCLLFGQRVRTPVTTIAELLPLLPHLLRCTRHSVHPPLRAVVYRALLHLCHTDTDVALVLREMPTLLNAAVATVLAYNAETPQCECAAAAEWLRRVVTLDMASAATRMSNEETTAGRLMGTALPLKLLDVTAAAVALGGQTGGGVCYATACLLSLLVVLHDAQRQSPREATPQISVLAPQGPLSRAAWCALVHAATLANERLSGAADAARGVGALRTMTFAVDAHARAQSMLEGVAVQYHFAALLLCGLHGILTPEGANAEQRRRAMPPAETLAALLTSVLAAPTPSQSVALVHRRLGAGECISVGAAAADVVTARMLETVYAAMLNWGCRLAVAWLAAACSCDAPGDTHAVCHVCDLTFPPCLYTSLAARMSDATLDAEVRQESLPLLANALLQLSEHLRRPTHSDAESKGDDDEDEDEDGSSGGGEKGKTSRRGGVAGELTTHAAALFVASMTLDATRGAVAAMQCRLVRDYAAATRRACSASQWLAGLLDRLARATSAATGAASATAVEVAEYTMALSLVCSLVSSPHCASLTGEQLQIISGALCEGLRFAATTRLATLQALRVIASSTQGRRCLLHEISTTGEPVSRTCFGRLLAITLQLPSQWSSARLGRAASSSGGGGSGRAGGPAATVAASSGSVECVLGCEVCAAVCGEDGAGFVAAVIRFRGVDKLRQLIEAYDARQKEPLPLHLLRLLAALSFSAEVQRVLFRCSNLMTIIIETAGEASVQGVLMLLVLRNLCFQPSLKTVLCQDDRVLLTLKAALACQPYVEVMVIADAGKLAAPAPSNTGAAVAVATGNNNNNNNSVGRTKGVITLRDDLSAQSTALQDWAKHVAYRAASRQQGGGTEGNKCSDASWRRHKAVLCDDDATVVEGEVSTPQYLLAKRQYLAMTALWSLVHDHQRGKMYVREVLQQEPTVNLRQLHAMRGVDVSPEWREGIEGLLFLTRAEQ